MRNYQLLVFTFAFILSAFLSLNADSVEWEIVPGAVSYQFQVLDTKEKIVQENKDLKENKIELAIIKPGKYKYKIGVVDNIGNVVYGEWVEFDIEENAEKSNEKEYLVQLEWTSVEGAKSYFVEIRNLVGKLVKALKTKTNQKEVKLKIGKYQYRTSYEKKGVKVWTDWKEIEVKAPEEKKKPFLSDRTNVLWRSALLPGWGQYYRKDAKPRTFSYPLAFSILLPLYYLNYKKNAEAQNKYDTGINLLILTQNSTSNSVRAFGAFSYLDNANARSELNTTYAQGNQLALLIAGVYILNLLDAAFFYDYAKPISQRQTTQVSFQSFKRQTYSFQVEAYSELSVKFAF